jgi:phosphate transport system permease protein
VSSDSSSSILPKLPAAQATEGCKRPLLGKRRLSADFVLAGLSRLGASFILLMLVALLVVLTMAAWPSITTYKARFLYTSQWRANSLDVPARDAGGRIVFDADGDMVTKTLPPQFGAWPVIYGTVVSSLLALLFAVPLSFGTALFLVRLCPRMTVASVSFLVEFLAAIPSIAYGMWALFVLGPCLQHYVEPGLKHALGWIPGVGAWLFTETETVAGYAVNREIPLTGNDMFCGGLVLAIMVLPIITAISRDVLRGVPRSQLEGALALGATWWQSSWEMLRYSRSGLFGAVILGLARAAGETMAVTMVIGNNTQVRASLFAPAQTMSSLLANEFAEANSDIHRSALAEVALILLVMSLLFNILARWLVVGSKPVLAQ